MILDAPLSIRGHAGKQWQPRNYSGKFHGATSLAEALAHSLDVVTVKLLQEVGVDKVRALAKACGIAEPITADLSLALGPGARCGSSRTTGSNVAFWGKQAVS